MSFRAPTEAEMLTVACPACEAPIGAQCADRPVDGHGWRAYWALGWHSEADKPTGHIARGGAWHDHQMWRTAEANRLADLADLAFAHREGYDEFEDEHGNDAVEAGAVAVHRRREDRRDRPRPEDDEPEGGW